MQGKRVKAGVEAPVNPSRTIDERQPKPLGARRWWPAVRALLGLVIVSWIGWRFWKDLSRPELWEKPLAVGWLVPAALSYLGGLSLSALYWRRLLGHLGHKPGLLATFRAYFVGQLGKYVPGKALALVMRAAFLRGAGVPAGLAGLAAFYEVLTTMAAGALLALVLFVLTGPGEVLAGGGEAFWDLVRFRLPDGQAFDRFSLVLLSLGLCAVTLGPIFPPVFNTLVHRVTIPFRTGPAPRIRTAWLAEGLVMLVPCWLLFGLALACALHAVPGAGLDWSVGALTYLTAVMALAYVAGFFVPIPGAVGAREFFLLVLLAGELARRQGLAPDVARGMVVLAVLVLRLAWTVAEVALAGVLYVSKVRDQRSEVRDQRSGDAGQESAA
jgi:uncharacterized membrane protein YbhN (UPF0104 family)